MKKYFVFLSIFILLLLAGCGGNTDLPIELGEENTLVSGTVAMPDSLIFYVDYNSLSILIASLLYESLCERDPDTLNVRGVLAKEWEIGDDKLTYTFHLNENAQWADGSPVTTDDVLFTYETIMNPDNLTGLFRMGFEQSFDDVYADEDSILSDWWHEDEKYSALKKAVKNGTKLLPEPINIYYNATLEPQG